MTRKHQPSTGLCVFGIVGVIIGSAVGYILFHQTERSLASTAAEQARALNILLDDEREASGSLFDFPISRELGIEVLAEPPGNDKSLLLRGNLICSSRDLI